MRILSELRERVYAVLFRRREERAMDEELRFHVERQIEANVKRGLDPAEARRRAYLKLGGIEQTKERVRDARGVLMFETLVRDVRRGARRLIGEPAFAVPVVLTLALGIGAVTAIFSVVDATLLRPLPFEDEERVVRIHSVAVPFRIPGVDRPKGWPDVGDMDSLDDVFSDYAVYVAGSLNLTGTGGDPQRIPVVLATTGFFSTLGVMPRLGRPFTAAEGRPEGDRVAILSDGVWRSRFGADPDVLDRTITLNDIDFRIVGVMPPGFAFPGEAAVWLPHPVPLTPQATAYRDATTSSISVDVVARLASGVTPGQAGERMVALYRSYRPSGEGVPTAAEAVRPLRGDLVEQRRTAMQVLLGATGLMLLIACANAGGLALARATKRRRELALRAVLGASSGRLVHQLLVESVLLALAGGALGVAIAFAATGPLEVLVPAALAGSIPLAVDGRVLAFALTAALASGVAFGTWPALRARTTEAREAIRSGQGRGATASNARRLRRAFVVGQVALALVLLVGAGIMIRSFRAVLASDPGLDADRVATAELSMASEKFPTGAAMRAFYDGVLQAARAQPGVERVAMVDRLPLRGRPPIRWRVTAEDASVDVAADEPVAAYPIVASPDYFRTLGIPLFRGRPFRVNLDTAGVYEVVINRTLARRLWPGEEPVGKRLRVGPANLGFPWRTVVGVVGDVRQQQLEQADILPQTYLPLGERLPDHVTLLARGAEPARSLGPRLRAAVRSVDPEQAVYNVRPMEDVIAGTLAPRRTTTRLVTGFGALALLLAALGIYGVIAFGVARRRQELGIRVALGARPDNVVRLVVREGLALAVLGAALGLAAAWALSRLLDGLVFGVSAQDPVAFAVAPVVLVGVATLAALVPALRATRVNPLESIRAE